MHGLTFRGPIIQNDIGSKRVLRPQAAPYGRCVPGAEIGWFQRFFDLFNANADWRQSGIIEVIGGSLARKRVGRRSTQVVGYKKYTNCIFLHSEQVVT